MKDKYKYDYKDMDKYKYSYTEWDKLYKKARQKYGVKKSEEIANLLVKKTKKPTKKKTTSRRSTRSSFFGF